MSWENYKERVEGVRKVYWDCSWHVLYRYLGGGETYDRVPKKVAMYVLRNMRKWKKSKNKS